MQRPYPMSSDQYTNVPKQNLQISEISRCRSRLGCEEEEEFPSKLASFDRNSPMKGSFFQPIPPILPSMSCSLGMLLSKLPSVTPPNSHAQSLTSARNNEFHAPNLPCSYSQDSGAKLNLFEAQERKPQFISLYSSDPCRETTFLQEFDVQDQDRSNISPML